MYDSQATTMGLEVTGNVTALAPTAADHLATKAYVDAAVSAGGGGGGGLKVYRSDGVTTIGNFLGYEALDVNYPVVLCKRMIYSDTSGNIQPVGNACAQDGQDVTGSSVYYFPNTNCSGNIIWSYPYTAGSIIVIKN